MSLCDNSKRVCLIILDGWGHSNNWAGNAISMANPKNFSNLWQLYGHKILDTFDKNKPINMNSLKSEICHTVISSGRYLKPIDEEISDKLSENEIHNNKTLNQAFEYSNKNDSAVHLISPLDESNKSIDHIKSMIKIVENSHVRDIFIHLVVHTKYDVSNKLKTLNQYISQYSNVKIVSIMSDKYISTDSDYANITQGFSSIINGQGKGFLNLDQGISSISDTSSDLEPMILIEEGKPVGILNDFDTVILTFISSEKIKTFFSYFATDINFKKIRKRYNLNVISLYDYLLELPAKYLSAFDIPQVLPNVSSLISENGLIQVHISDSKKSDNVGYYFDGRSKTKFPGERRLTILSEAENLAEAGKLEKQILKLVIDQIMNSKTNFILANFANVDHFAHNGSINETAKAVSMLDDSIGIIANAAMRTNTALIITSDHGNAESMTTSATEPKTFEHTKNPVPFILVSKESRKSNEIKFSHPFKPNFLTKHGSVIDIGPTILELFGINQPEEFSGESLINNLE